MRTIRQTLAVVVLMVCCAASESAFGCPNCKEAMANQTGDAARLKDGYYHSILLMMAMPFAILGTGTFFVARAVKKGMLPEM